MRKKLKGEMTECYSLLNLRFPSFPVIDFGAKIFPKRFPKSISFSHPSSKFQLCGISRAMEVVEGSEESKGSSSPLMKLLFVEMGVGYDQHGCSFFALLTFSPYFFFFFSFVGFANMGTHETDRT